MSVILRPKIAPFQASQVTLIAAVSTAEAIRQQTLAPCLIKWPNDILLNGKKIAGILTEMDAEQDSVNFIIVGIGINVNTKKEDLPKGASSIFEETQAKVSRIGLAKRLLENLEENYILLEKKGFPRIIKHWCDLSATIGKRVRVISMHKRTEGEAMGIDGDGALIIRLDNGFQEKVLAGDIIHLR